MNIIIEAAQYAALAHRAQKRKYNGEPYFYHPQRVASRAMQIPGITEIIVAGCYTHDIWEDCPDFWPLPERFPSELSWLVTELTNPSKEFPQLPRADRKSMDREHLKRVGREAKIIKYLDRIDNLNDMALADHGFKCMYLRESRLLADALKLPLNPSNDLYQVVLGNLNRELNLLIDHLTSELRVAA